MEFDHIRSLLLQLAGREVRRPTRPGTLELIVAPRPLSLAVRRLPDAHRQCHRNVAALYDRRIVHAIGTGFALAEDGVWHRHSWGLENRELCETCGDFTRYWGGVVPDAMIGAFLRFARDA
jgi:hypothetical protein